MISVLVVDDSLVEQRIAGACVEKCNGVPIFASNGREALDKLGALHLDAVLTDLRMPEMDGLELVKRIRRDHASIPVILMTAFGSEDVAAEALQAGAASYVAKKNLKQELRQALNAVHAVVQVAKQRDQARQLLKRIESSFVLGYDPGDVDAMVTYLRDCLDCLNFCDAAEIWQVSTALTEAINNAIEHGNLELNSELRESAGDEYRRVRIERTDSLPYRDRKVRIYMEVTSNTLRVVISDEGPGFDPSTLPDPTDAENLLKPSGRGLLLIRTFMDEVTFSDSGSEITMIKRRPETAVQSATDANAVDTARAAES